MNLKPTILQALRGMRDNPMTDVALRQTVGMAHDCLETEYQRDLRELESQGKITGVRNEDTGYTLWTLTTKGKLAASQLP